MNKKTAWGYLLWQGKEQFSVLPSRLCFELSAPIEFELSKGGSVRTCWVESRQDVFGVVSVVALTPSDECPHVGPRLAVHLEPLPLCLSTKIDGTVNQYLTALGYEILPWHKRERRSFLVGEQ